MNSIHPQHYYCEVCGTEISEELHRFTFDLCFGHSFCHNHKNEFLKFLNEMVKHVHYNDKDNQFVYMRIRES